MEGKEVKKMYGTVARVKAKAGFLEVIENSLKQRRPKGFIRWWYTGWTRMQMSTIWLWF